MNEQKPFSRYTKNGKKLLNEYKILGNTNPMKRFCSINVSSYTIDNFRLLLKANGKKLSRNRNISGVVNNAVIHQTFYNMEFFLRGFNNLSAIYFDTFPYHAVKYIDVVGNFVFSAVQPSANGPWYMKTLPVYDLMLIFPSGVPTTEKNFNRWWSYVCYMQLENKREELKSKLRQLNDVERAKLEIESLREKIEKLENYIAQNTKGN